jgi:hypothetical protein
MRRAPGRYISVLICLLALASVTAAGASADTAPGARSAAAVTPDDISTTPGTISTIDQSFHVTWSATPTADQQAITNLENSGEITPASLSDVLGASGSSLDWKTDAACDTPYAAVSALDSQVKLGGWCFSSADETGAWTPQGVAVSPPGTGDVMVSWYKGSSVRVTLSARPTVDTDGSYRAITLLVPSASAPYASDLSVHAGGIAWVGHYLYVADTYNGFRVFDLDQIYKVSTGESTVGDSGGSFYADGSPYALFQIGRYVYGNGSSDRCNADRDSGDGNYPDAPDTDLCFSTLSTDLSFSTPSLITSEYRVGAAITASIANQEPVRVVRWPLNSDGLLAADSSGVVDSVKVYGTYTPRIQGAVAHVATQSTTDGDEPVTTVYLDTSDGSSLGTIYSDRGWRDPWSIAGVLHGEGIDYNASEDRLWGVTEGSGQRMLFWVYRTDMQPSTDN